MSHRRAALGIGALAVLGGALAACQDSAPPPKPPSTCTPPPGSDVPVIGLSRQDTCPRPADSKEGRWDVAPVFPAEPGEVLPPSMARLCAYTWTGCAAPATDALPVSELVFAAEDPFVVTPLAPASKVQTDIVTAARARLTRAVDALVPLPAVTTATPVFLGIPDTSPAPPKAGDEIPLDIVPHGFDVAWITRYLTCPGGSLKPCLGHVHTDLALGRPGGRGARADLAASIVRLIRKWKSEGGPSKLVLPIASGWEPLAESALPWLTPVPEGWSPTGPQDLPAPPLPPSAASAPAGSPAASPQPSPGTRAVWAALQYAACHGALVIAAAGNDPGYRDSPSGAMLPAAWETTPAPTLETCKALFGESPVPRLTPSKTAYTPLLHAVGGVDDRDQPVVGTRTKSLPRLVAPASLLAAFPDDHADAGYARLCAPKVDVTRTFVCERTSARTGTSMAAAVAGAVAAVAWAHRPDLSPHDLMAAVYTGGVSLGEKPDLSLTPAAKDPVTRISLCGALAAACKGAPKGTCPDRLPCAKPPAFARGPKPSPFITPRPGLLPLAIDRRGAPTDPVVACPTCVFHITQVQSDGCELTGTIPATLFQTAPITRLHHPTLDVYDALGRRLGFVEEAGFRPRMWSAAEKGDQPIFADAASCGNAAHVVLRWTACADEACSQPQPMAAELPVVP